ncbi:MAG TPA: type II toxin-antitoxin system prevent-host-death family antitoxin [Agromyces sp.]|nr:type II toxin-antitoxin system prevent-host-death family antitoxin [Agromyces sp.]
MRTMTATDASRAFAALLDEAERGETIIITRGGRRIATVGPADFSNGSEIVALLAEAPVDDEFASDVAAAREAVELIETAWPAD